MLKGGERQVVTEHAGNLVASGQARPRYPLTDLGAPQQGDV
jgi:hypothetical protein